jgi:hypothetical protein
LRKQPQAQIPGSVTSSPAGISCGPSCSNASASFPAGTVVTLTASAQPPFRFDEWSGDCGGTAACVVTMDADRDVVARFTRGGNVAQAEPSAVSRAVRLQSTLGIRGGRGQVSVNGVPTAVGEGVAYLELPARAGDNVVEAQLTAAASGGYWRFDLADERLLPGSLRVVAGELAAAGVGTLTFRAHGRVGERVAFAWTSGSGANATAR